MLYLNKSVASDVASPYIVLTRSVMCTISSPYCDRCVKSVCYFLPRQYIVKIQVRMLLFITSVYCPFASPYYVKMQVRIWYDTKSVYCKVVDPYDVTMQVRILYLYIVNF